MNNRETSLGSTNPDLLLSSVSNSSLKLATLLPPIMAGSVEEEDDAELLLLVVGFAGLLLLLLPLEVVDEWTGGGAG